MPDMDDDPNDFDAEPLDSLAAAVFDAAVNRKWREARTPGCYRDASGH